MRLTQNSKYLSFAYLNGMTADFVRISPQEEERVAQLLNDPNYSSKKVFVDSNNVEYTPKEVVRSARKSQGRRAALKLDQPGNELDDAIRVLQGNRDLLNDIRRADRYQDQRRGTDKLRKQGSVKRIGDGDYKVLKARLETPENLSRAREVREALDKVDRIRNGAQIRSYQVKGLRSVLNPTENLTNAAMEADWLKNAPQTGGKTSKITRNQQAGIPAYLNIEDAPKILDAANQPVKANYKPSVPDRKARSGTRRASDRISRVLTDLGVERQNPMPRQDTAQLRLNQLKDMAVARAKQDIGITKENAGKALKQATGAASNAISDAPNTFGNLINKAKQFAADRKAAPQARALPTPPEAAPTSPAPSPQPSPGPTPPPSPAPTPDPIPDPTPPPIPDPIPDPIPNPTPAPTPKAAKAEKPAQKVPSLKDIQNELDDLVDTPIPKVKATSTRGSAVRNTLGKLPIGRKGLLGVGALVSGLGILGTASALANNQREQAKLKQIQAQQGYLGNPTYPPTYANPPYAAAYGMGDEFDYVKMNIINTQNRIKNFHRRATK